MQEEVDQKTIALAVKTGKLTAQVLQAAIRKYLAARQKGTAKTRHGQQSLRQLKKDGSALSNIEITDANIGLFKDLTKVKSKVVFGLTKRQLICFGGALLVGVPLFFLIRGRVPTSAAALIMVFAMLPGFLLALYEKHGQSLEVVVRQIVECCFIQPKERPYQTNNAYTALVRQSQMEKEVNAIVQKAKERNERKSAGQAHPRRKERDSGRHPKV